MDRFFVGLNCGGDREYTIGNYTFVVSSRFKPLSEAVTLADKIEKHVESDFAHFTTIEKGDMITEEYIPTAGKEEKCSQVTQTE